MTIRLGIFILAKNAYLFSRPLQVYLSLSEPVFKNTSCNKGHRAYLSIDVPHNL